MTTSSTAERPTVNRMVPGSNPGWSAVSDWPLVTLVTAVSVSSLMQGVCLNSSVGRAPYL